MPESKGLIKVKKKKERGDHQNDQSAHGPDLANRFPLPLSQESGHYRSGIKTHMKTGDVEINSNKISYRYDIGNVIYYSRMRIHGAPPRASIATRSAPM